MENFVENITIHGIKDAYKASGRCRLMWTIIFVSCVFLMFLQLRGVVTSYINQSVGTRAVHPKREDMLDAPSFYYCNRHWLPSTNAFKAFMDCSYPYDHKTQKYKVVSDAVFYDDCYPAYWKEKMKEEFVNTLLFASPLNEVDYSVAPLLLKYHPAFQHNRIQNHNIRVDQVFQDFFRELTVEHNGSMMNFLTKTTTIPGKGGAFPASGVLTRAMSMLEAYNRGSLTNYSLLINAFRNPDGIPVVTSDGFCWEIKDNKGKVRFKDTVDKRVDHVVVHYGGYGYGLEHFVKRWGVSAGPDGRNYLTVKLPHPNPIPQMKLLTEFQFKTEAFIHAHGKYFVSNRIELSSSKGQVLVKFWTNKFTRLNRRGSTCRSDWSSLDREHCFSNAKIGSLQGEKCVKYLPASVHFAEKQITNNSCQMSKTNNLDFEMKAFYLLSGRAAKAGASGGVASRLPRAVVESTKEDCAEPCSETTFQIQVSYQSDSNIACDLAIGSQLLVGGSQNRKIDFARLLIWRNYVENGSNFVLPCSVVSYFRTKTEDQHWEEYFLQTLPDIASKVGGSLGLWLGASVISFVQAGYFCWMTRIRKPIVLGSNDIYTI